MGVQNLQNWNFASNHQIDPQRPKSSLEVSILMIFFAKIANLTVFMKNDQKSPNHNFCTKNHQIFTENLQSCVFPQNISKLVIFYSKLQFGTLKNGQAIIFASKNGKFAMKWQICNENCKCDAVLCILSNWLT